jgi:putative modified peptide
MSFNLPEPIVDELLDKLGHDDDFRIRFTADPRAALAQLGFAAAEDAAVDRGIWNCLQVAELASKEAIRAGRVQLRSQLMARSSYKAFALEVVALKVRAA